MNWDSYVNEVWKIDVDGSNDEGILFGNHLVEIFDAGGITDFTLSSTKVGGYYEYLLTMIADSSLDFSKIKKSIFDAAINSDAEHVSFRHFQEEVWSKTDES